MKSLKDILYLALHSSKKSASEIADQLGVSENYLYRSVMPTESGVKFPVELLIPFMRATENFQPLRHIAHRSGFFLFKPVSPSKVKPRDILTGYQQSYLELVKNLQDFFEKPSNKQAILDQLDRFQEYTATLKYFLSRYEIREFDFDDLA